MRHGCAQHWAEGGAAARRGRGGGAQARSKVAAGTRLRARCCAHGAARKGQGICTLGARLLRGRRRARKEQSGCAHAAARTRLRARGGAAARSEQGCGTDGMGRLRERGGAVARTRSTVWGGDANVYLSERYFNCNLMLILKFSKCVFQQSRNARQRIHIQLYPDVYSEVYIARMRICTHPQSQIGE